MHRIAPVRREPAVIVTGSVPDGTPIVRRGVNGPARPDVRKIRIARRGSDAPVPVEHVIHCRVKWDNVNCARRGRSVPKTGPNVWDARPVNTLMTRKTRVWTVARMDRFVCRLVARFRKPTINNVNPFCNRRPV